jgi:hypothetical protein
MLATLFIGFLVIREITIVVMKRKPGAKALLSALLFAELKSCTPTQK